VSMKKVDEDDLELIDNEINYGFVNDYLALCSHQELQEIFSEFLKHHEVLAYSPLKIETSPKFEIGQKVSHKSNLVGETDGVIYERERCFRAFDRVTGRQDGMITTESSIDSIAIPHEFDGRRLVVHFPSSNIGEFSQKSVDQVSEFYCWGYSVKSATGFNTLVIEKHLKALNS